MVVVPVPVVVVPVVVGLQLGGPQTVAQDGTQYVTVVSVPETGQVPQQ